MLCDEIYKYDSKGNLRSWQIQIDGDKYKTIAGLVDGKKVISEWTIAKPTNVGRSNERNSVQQCQFEVKAAYEYKLTREYSISIDGAKNGAHFFKPMLANKYHKFESGYYQVKLDGIRAIATKDGLFSRQGKPIVACPHIEESLKPLFEADPNLIFDGELYNHDLKDDFNEIVSIVRKKKPTEKDLEKSRHTVEYWVYDLPSKQKTYGNRHMSYMLMLDSLKHIKPLHTTQVSSEDEFLQLHAEALSNGFEGSMLRLDSTYEQKRSKNLIKYKEFQDAEFEVVGIEEGKGNWSGMAKRVICRLPDGREFGAGIKGNQKRAKELLHETHKVVTVEFFEYTPDGIPRFPIAVKFWGNERTL